MKTKLSFVLLIFLVSFVNIYAQEKEGPFKYFFKPRPINTVSSREKPTWDLKPTVQIPAIKVTESVRENSLLDATLLASAGGGITYQRTIIKNGSNYASFSWSPILILLNGDTSQDKPIDVSWCTTIGFFNNLLQAGFGVDFGKVENRSRIFGVLSVGINLTNN